MCQRVGAHHLDLRDADALPTKLKLLVVSAHDLRGASLLDGRSLPPEHLLTERGVGPRERLEARGHSSVFLADGRRAEENGVRQD